MRIATWNINGLRARQGFVLHWLAARKPDLVGLQELKLTDDQFPHEAFAEAGYRAVCHGQKGWNGVAVLARTEIEPVQSGLPGQEAFGARLLTVQSGALRFTTLYCPNGKSVQHEDYQRKLGWFDALAEHLQGSTAAGEAAVLCGDFNIVPAPLDSWNEEKNRGDIFHTEAERTRMAALRSAGWRDLFRELHPDTQAFSWWDYRGGAFHRGHGLRIDLLFGTDAVARGVRSASIDREYRKKKEGLTASDHAPVFADLAL